MARLNKINALVTGLKSENEKMITEDYKELQKSDLFSGMTRTYRALDAENGEQLPSETKKIQRNAKDLWETVTKRWTGLWDLTLAQDTGNQTAVADVRVDDVVVLTDVPVCTLLFLEKQINDVITLLGKMPTPDSSENWTYDPNQGSLRSGTITTLRNKKEPTVLVKYEATKEHPAQTEVYQKDVPVGTWSVVNFSSALPSDTKKAMMERARKLKDALKMAREEANMTDVKPVKMGEAIFNWISAAK